jgi:hypothetical protein
LATAITRTTPATSDAPEPPGTLLFPHADLEPPNPGVTTYEDLGWTATGGLVHQPVATGAIGGQQPVSGFEGIGLINTFTNGNDQAQGTLTSPTFTITHPYINFLIGGGNHPYPGNNDATAVLLLVNGQVVNSATGQNNEALNWVFFNVSQYIGAARCSLLIALFRRAQSYSATLRLFKVESGINGLLPTSWAPSIYSVSRLSRLRSALGRLLHFAFDSP